MRRVLVFVLSSIGLVACGLAIWLVLLVREGARHQPSALETSVARQLRHLAIPKSAREAKSPIAASAEILAEGREHFADHCAICHANDGSGDTTIGRNLYPPAPNMREQPTQSLSDGELWFVIHYGIPLSGMPAWGENDPDEHDSWELVHFIRHLPQITEQEVSEMEKRNPKGAHEHAEEEEAREFLHGKPAAAGEGSPR